MPNWCQNVAYIGHDEPEKLEQIVNELKKGDDAQLFNSLVPNPNGEWQYDWSVSNWGTKWDASIYDYKMEDGRLYISFDTAWGPPIAFYDAIGQLGYYVEAFYREEGMAFCGQYDNGLDDYYEYGDMTADEIEENIPTAIDEMFSISEYQRSCEEDEAAMEEWDAEAELDKILPPDEPTGSQVNTPEGREWLRGLLHNEEVKITFTKKDGTEREMLCTLVNDKIPSEKAPKNTGKSGSDEAIAVFDLDKNDWRSFRWDSVKKIEFTLGE